MITKANDSKAMAEHISCHLKCKFNSTICDLNQKWNNKTCNVKTIVLAKKIIVGILAHVFVRILSIWKVVQWLDSMKL